MRRIKLLFPFPFKTRRNQIPFRSKNVTMLPCFHPPFSTPPLSVSVNQKLIEDYIFLTVRHLGGWFKCFTREKSEYMKLIVAKNDLSSLIPMQGHGLSSLKSMQQHAGLFEFETNENSWSFEFETNGNSNLVPRLFLRGRKDPGRSWSRDRYKIYCLRGYGRSIK